MGSPWLVRPKNEFYADRPQIGNRLGGICIVAVNDNPNIDAGVEDIVEGQRLYERLAEDLARRIEQDRVSMASEKSLAEKQP